MDRVFGENFPRVFRRIACLKTLSVEQNALSIFSQAELFEQCRAMIYKYGKLYERKG